MTAVQGTPPTTSIIVPNSSSGQLPPPVDTLHRAIHRISLSSLSHNFSEVESAAQRQRCDVICVTKADSYGHGAIATALYLSDSMGAGAFAVATLGEAIALRKAFQESKASSAPTAPSVKGNANHVSSLFQAPADDVTISTAMPMSTTSNLTALTKGKRSLRPANIRILVLGPPVGFPRCFDDYFHHNIEVMISGPEVAQALFEWIHNPDERKRVQVERAAEEAKKLALSGQLLAPPPRTMPNPLLEHRDSNVSDASTSEASD